MPVIQNTGKWLARWNKFPVATILACYELAQLMCSYLTKKKLVKSVMPTNAALTETFFGQYMICDCNLLYLCVCDMCMLTVSVCFGHFSHHFQKELNCFIHLAGLKNWISLYLYEKKVILCLGALRTIHLVCWEHLMMRWRGWYATISSPRFVYVYVFLNYYHLYFIFYSPCLLA